MLLHRLRLPSAGWPHFLWFAVVEDLEVVFGEVDDRLSSSIEGYDVDFDQLRIHPDRLGLLVEEKATEEKGD